MTPDIVSVSTLVSLALGSINLLILVKNMLSAGEKKLEERVNKVEATLVNHDRRLQSVESDLNHLPDKDTANRLQLALERLSGRIDTLDERMKPVAATNMRLQEFLLEQSKK